MGYSSIFVSIQDVNAQDFDATNFRHHQPTNRNWRMISWLPLSEVSSKFILLKLRKAVVVEPLKQVFYLTPTSWLITRDSFNNKSRWLNCRLHWSCTEPHSHGCEECRAATNHVALRCTCVNGQWGEDVVTDLHGLKSADEKVNDPVAKGGTEAQVLELNDDFGEDDCVERQAVSDEQHV